MVHSILRGAVLTAAATLLLFSCEKPVFVPEIEVIPEVNNDEVGVYEAGIYVTVNGSGTLSGEDWKDAMSENIFREKLLSGAFSSGTVIHLEGGNYALGTSASSVPTVSTSLIIKGGYRSGIYTQYPEKYATYLTGGTDWRILTVSSGATLTLDGVGFTGSTGAENMGAVYVNDGTLKISNATICNNFSPYAAGAIQVSAGGKLEASSCTFKNNVANKGGAIYVDSSNSSCALSECKIYGNLAHHSGGAIYATSGTVTIKGCSFKGNESVQSQGGSFYIKGGAKLYCDDSNFYQEHTGNRGSVLGFEEEGTEAFFNQCVMDNCSSIVTSSLFYNNADYGKLYFNGCTIKNSEVAEKYGVIAVTNSPNMILGFNNCAMTGAFSTWENANSQQCCWFNINKIRKLTMSNCSLIGVPKSDKKELPKFGLLRMNGDEVNAHFFNNIIASTSVSGCGIYGGDTQKNLTVTGKYNKMSPVSTQVAGTFDYQLGEGDSAEMFAEDFQDLAWDGNAWTWENTSMTTPTANVNAAIQAYDPDFYAWLSSIGALNTDIYGNPRGDNSWPGSYQK